MNDPNELMRMIADNTSSAAWQEAERRQREIQSQFASMGLARSGPLLQASLENYLKPANRVAESLTTEYEKLTKALNITAAPGNALHLQFEEIIREQTARAEERLRRDAEASGLGYDVIRGSMDAQREHLVSSLVRALEVVDARRRITAAESWPTLGVAPDETDADVLVRVLFSRRAFDRDLAIAGPFAHEEPIPLSLMMIDVDNFKKVNDDFGHPTGDRVLIAVGEAIRRVVGDRGRCYRYGGEEFAVILPNANVEEALPMAERLRSSVEAMSPSVGDRPVTISIGISCFPTLAPDTVTLVNQADAELYRAKEAGKNCVVGSGLTRDESNAPRRKG